MKHKIVVAILLGVSLQAPAAVNFNQLYQTWSGGNTLQANANQGKQAWNRAGNSGKKCASCHSNNLQAKGKHVKTKKVIKPLSPKANAKSLTSVKKINKWLKRNCKFVYKRECNPQEKINFVEFIRHQ